MAYPRSRHLSSRMNARLGLGKRVGMGYLVAGVVAGSMLAYGAFRRNYGPGSFATEDTVVLTLDLTSPPKELNTPSLLQPTQRPSHYDTLRVLDYASKDQSVRGLMARVGPGGEWNMAQAQEIRQASPTGNKHSATSTATRICCSHRFTRCSAVVCSRAVRTIRASSLTHSQTHSVSRPTNQAQTHSGGLHAVCRAVIHRLADTSSMLLPLSRSIRRVQ